jgi:hypothetical protein
VEWLIIPLRIRDVSGSNLGPETGYPGKFFMAFLSPSLRMPIVYLEIILRLLPSKSFPIQNSLITLTLCGIELLKGRR